MASVTVRGSIMPCGFLARGAEATVQRTPFVDRLIAQGFLDVLVEHDDSVPAQADERTEDEQYHDDIAQAARDELGVPHLNASREDWAEFLATKPGIVTEGKNRAQLIEAWRVYDPDQHTGTVPDEAAAPEA